MKEKNKLLFNDIEKATGNLKIAIDKILDAPDVDGVLNDLNRVMNLGISL
jgi:hypothetical protein